MNINKIYQKLENVIDTIKSMHDNIEKITKDTNSYISDGSTNYLDMFYENNKKAVKQIEEIKNDLSND